MGGIHRVKPIGLRSFMRKVLTAGTFDCLHAGHVIFLQRARQLGDHLTVLLGTDDYVKSYKQKAPLFDYQERKNVLELLPFVDTVQPNDQNNLMTALSVFHPDILVIGSDWGDRYFDQIGVSQKWLVTNHIMLVYLPYTPEISTTQIIERAKLWQNE